MEMEQWYFEDERGICRVTYSDWNYKKSNKMENEKKFELTVVWDNQLQVTVKVKNLYLLEIHEVMDEVKRQVIDQLTEATNKNK